MAYATVDQLQSRWPNMPEDVNLDQVEARLEDASTWIRVKYPDLPTRPSADLQGVLTMIVSNMVRRSFSNAEYEGVASYSESAGVFSESRTFHPGSGDNLYLTKQEAELLEFALWGPRRAAGSFEVRGM